MKKMELNAGKLDWRVSVVALIVVFAIIVALLLYGNRDGSLLNDEAPAEVSQVIMPPVETNDGAVQNNMESQKSSLLYLIEEEKLAHDVYAAMYQIYGAQTFGNILKSEESHQSRVLTLLQARNMADPRQAELGKFTNRELQSLYDKLFAQGKQSLEDAYRVGVVIEEKDIADITKQLATATDSDIVATLEALRSGSESHLRAFNRQLSRY